MKAGDTLWYVPEASWMGSPREVIVSRIGRKWIAFNDGRQRRTSRADRETLRVPHDEPVGCGQLWPSREAWDRRTALDCAWVSLRIAIDGERVVPAGVTTERIEQARELLGLPKEG